MKQTRDSLAQTLAEAAHEMCSQKGSTFILTDVETANHRRASRGRDAKPRGGDQLRPLGLQIFNVCAGSARMRASEHNTQPSEVDRAV